VPINQFQTTSPQYDNNDEPGLGAEEMEIEFEDGELEVETAEDEALEELAPEPYGVDTHFEDLTYLFDDDELDRLGQSVLAAVEEDEQTRSVWMANAITGLKLLGLNLGDQSGAIVNGGCYATHPLILETAIKFQSKASTELLPAYGPADTKIIGKKTQEKIDRAGRVKQHLNYQLTEKMTEFYPDSEKTYLFSALFGDAFKKTWYDPDKRRPCSIFVPADQFIVSNNATDLCSAERYTHTQALSERTVMNRMTSGFYKFYEMPPEADPTEPDYTAGSTGTAMSAGTLAPYDIKLSEFAEEFNNIMGVQNGQTGTGFLVYEHFCYYDFKNKPELKDEFGRKVPYVITVDSESGKVLSIRRNWAETDPIDKKRLDNFTQYGYIPSFGFYSFGLIHILGNVQMVMTALLRSLVDSGIFANLQGGMKVKGPRITGPTEAFQMGEYRDVEVPPGQSIRDVLLPHQFKEPSAVVQALLVYLDQRGGEFANSTDQILQGSTNYGPVGTTMALLEAAGKMYAAIYKRFHKAQSNELKIIASLNYHFMDVEEGYPFEVNLPEGKDEGVVYREDYDPKQVSIIPVSDPNVSSQAHRISIGNAVLDAATKAKGIDPSLAIDFPVLLKAYIQDLDPQRDVNEIIRPPKGAKPLDPMSDLFAVMNGEPIKAFEGQDHQAHIMFKQAWLDDPDQGGSKVMQQFSPQIIANIREHALMAFQEKVGAMVTGIASDDQSKEMLMAQAAQQLSQMAQLAKTQDTPENKVADAVLKEAEVKAGRLKLEEKNATFENLMKLVQNVIAASREQNRAAESESKVDVDQLALLKDFMLKSEEIKLKRKKD